MPAPEYLQHALCFALRLASGFRRPDPAVVAPAVPAADTQFAVRIAELVAISSAVVAETGALADPVGPAVA